MATITRRQNPSGKTVFRVRVRVEGHPVVSKTFARRTDAKEWGKRREVEIRDGLVFGRSRNTLGDAIARYLAEEVGKLAPTERRNRVAQLSWWKERRGKELLVTLRRSVLLDDLRRLRTGEIAPKGRPVAVATANRYGAALSAVLSVAVDIWEWLPANPLHRASRRKKSKAEREVERNRELTAEERERLWAACRRGKEKRGGGVDARLYGLVVCARASGARQGELMGMLWKRLELRPSVYDPETGTTRVGVPRVTVLDTKNGTDRVLYFPGEAAEILQAMAKQRHLSRYVWSEPGTPANQAPKFPTQAFRCAVRRARIEDFHFHDLRHMWACDLLDSGANLAQLMTLGGWRSANMVRRYTSRAQRQGSTPVERLHTRTT